MALGGGFFLTQNKVLPGAYINFISAARASATLSDRGIAAMPFVADWGEEGKVIEVTTEDFQKYSLQLFGYDYTHPQMQMFREIFKNAKVLYGYRLNSGTTKAKNDYAVAKYGGSRGNAITIVIENDVDTEGGFLVKTLLENTEADIQSVKKAQELQDNDFVTFQKEATLQTTAGMPLTGGTDGEGRTGANYQKFLEKIEKYSFHTLGCNSAEQEIIDLFIAFTKRMRDEQGVKFQTVVYRAENADYEGIISVENKLLNVDESLFGEFSLVYWVTGASAGCAVNKSNVNKVYDGEYEIDTNYTQRQLEDGVKKGKFLFHKVGEEVRVLDDINTFVSVTVDKNEDFQSNQVIRVLDQIGNDIAVLFNTKYLGKVQNNNAGRIAFWNDLVTYNNELQRLQAITDFEPEQLIVEQGESKKSVVVTNPVTPVMAMSKLYMTVIVN
mgnify:FL=1